MEKLVWIHYGLTFIIYGLLIYGFTMFPRTLYEELRYILRLSKWGETSRSHNRRNAEGFFQKYTQGVGLDIGHGGDKITQNCLGWDMDQGDAQKLDWVKDTYFDFVYASHCLEHMVNLEESLTNWWRVLKPGGFLIFAVPDRELYEKKKTLPSLNNPDHKHFFLKDEDEAPDTVGVNPLIERVLTDYKIEYVRLYGPESSKHKGGEYQIEAVIQKIK